VVRVEVDTCGVSTAAGQLRARADDLRGLAPPVRRWPTEVRDPGLRGGVATLAAAVVDLLEVMALDQDVLADKARVGARLYAEVEQDLAATAVTTRAAPARSTP
jgi:hypothetical protein